MRTAYRRILNVLGRLGVQVSDLGSGTVVLSRPGGGQRYAVTKMRPGTWAVARVEGQMSEELEDVRLGRTGARLLFDAGQTDERPLQLAAAAFLCGHHVTGLLEKYEVNCVFDVGANSGQYATRLRRMGYRGRIVSFEPTANAFSKLQEAAGNDPAWHVHRLALGREDAVQSIHVDWSTMNSLLPPSEYGRARYQRFGSRRTEEVQTRRLDGLMDQALDGLSEPRPFLKMDTQGFDLEVFVGAGERIQEFVGMQSEVAALRLYEGSPGMHEAIAVYEENGFEITGMYPVTREPTTGRVVEFDCVMVRASALPGTTDAAT